jgi:hypothetical protein
MRKNYFFREYIEQIYVDKFASINEKFIYKKNRNNLSAYQVPNYHTSVGHEECTTQRPCWHSAGMIG